MLVCEGERTYQKNDKQVWKHTRVRRFCFLEVFRKIALKRHHVRKHGITIKYCVRYDFPKVNVLRKNKFTTQRLHN